MTARVPPHPSEPIEPRPAPPPGDPAAPPPTVQGEGMMVPGGPQTGTTLTTAQGLHLVDTDHSLKGGPRGPSLLEDFHLREKITHFDHERIPERVVHARGTGAHGTFRAYGTAVPWTRARFLATADAQTPVFVRFSTVVGSRGSADTVRDTRGFAVKFYTTEGTFDLVGNNMPVFFIQDGIKFPDVIHAAKPRPDVEIPQAQTAHDTFWDFVSLHTEATHHVLWNMSDRALPRSFRMMEGFGVHTFRLVNEAGDSVLVKFHWKPRLGVHSLVWEEAQIAAGVDPDFHRRDLAEAISAGTFPQWELGVQVMPDTQEETYEGIDLLDPTKIVREELCPVQPIGLLTLDRNPTNFFAETEQAAFHLGNLVPGIEPTNDPLLQARLFSYLDTQLTRLGGPNFMQLPINRPVAEVNDNLRDGAHQMQIHTGVAPYTPNTLGGGDPHPDAERGYLTKPVPVWEGWKLRQSPATFSDHFSQAAMFYRSLAPVEQWHVQRAFSFELSKVHTPAIRQRMVDVLARVDTGLAEAVAEALGTTSPDVPPVGVVVTSPALSQLGGSWPVSGRVVGIVTTGVVAGEAEALSASALGGLASTLREHGAVVRWVTPSAMDATPDGRDPERTWWNARSVEFDALVVAPDAPLPLAPEVAVMVGEAIRHCKPVAVPVDAIPALVGADGGGLPPGVFGSDGLDPHDLLAALARHRVWERETSVASEVA